MRTPAYSCECCGSGNLRLSRRQSTLELFKTWLGLYPFRCMDCNHRFWINIWLFSKLAYAKCPKCLGGDLTSPPPRGQYLPVRKKLAMTFGAHRYRCVGCHYSFLSFRPSERAVSERASNAGSEAQAEESPKPRTLPDDAD